MSWREFFGATSEVELPFQFASDWISRLFGKLIEAKQSREQELDIIGDTFGDPLELAKFYVEPDCQQFNPADDDEDEMGYVVREPVFRRLESFFSGTTRAGKHQLFILSDAGMGKTSLLVMLKLSHLTSFWPKGYDCILLKLGPSTLEDIEGLTGRRNLILLLDALDEDPVAWGRVRERITDLLKATENFRRVVITCRTQFFSADEDPFNRRGQVEVGGFLCPVIYNSLFNDEQMVSYIRKRFGKNKRADELMEKSKFIIRKMGSLKFRPMLLTHIEDFLEADLTVWNEYTIYQTLVQVWLLREFRKALQHEEYRPTIDELWHACRLLALHLQKRGSREISEPDLKGLIFELPDLRHIPMLEITGRSLLNKNSAGAHRFSHYTVQEFLLVNGSVHGAFHLGEESVQPTAQMNAFFAAWLADPIRQRELPADLNAYDLTHANLANAKLAYANLHGIDLTGANLSGADFTGAELQWGKFVTADLRGTNFEKAKLHWGNFEEARYDRTTKWPHTGAPDGAKYKEDTKFP
jgi:uncharacterized protein YjbI with pentapeptide repeats